MEAIYRHFSVYRRVKTDASHQRVMDELEDALRNTVGGTLIREGDAFQIYDGNNNLPFGFVADVNASVIVKKVSDDTWELDAQITLQPNQLFWITAIVGIFCLQFLWVFNVLYFVIDPRTNYQKALDRIDLSASRG